MLRTVVTVLAISLVGAGGGWLLAGTLGAILGGAAGALCGVAVVRAGVRPAVATTVALGTAAGALVGQGIVRALCLPGSCPGQETVGAVITAVGALIGVGLVVALVTRSFDEYHEAVAAKQPPPTPGCETGVDER